MGYRMAEEMSPTYDVVPAEYIAETQISRFYLKNLDGYVVIYSEKTIFDYTDISLESLEPIIRNRINLGYSFDNLDELYDYLKELSH